MTVFYSGLSITIFATGIQLVTECRLAGPEFEMSYDSFGSKAALIGLRLPLANYIIERGCLGSLRSKPVAETHKLFPFQMRVAEYLSPIKPHTGQFKLFRSTEVSH
jgi:hypothetical protein